MANTTPHIVRLDGWVSPAPIFSPSFKHTYTSHDRTPSDTTTISSRLATADIAITTRVPITTATLSQCPRLKLIAVFAIGIDMIDLAACKEHGVQVCNVPAASNEAVAEHAIALFFALRRNVCLIRSVYTNGKGGCAKSERRADGEE
ncbi:putative 2-hydroxyacid dehydrogenase [Lachnellula subtilissima]|uniref:Putative 2-hydroxyacid dehydrogenase n=1 Tax=Lachnellula subtilissima TaxID=602034 RepID=A0A8H8RD96_9HELO|nr:putative 2-hydroxyacid dehydrogenase [Lachnellula subtilissima]